MKRMFQYVDSTIIWLINYDILVGNCAASNNYKFKIKDMKQKLIDFMDWYLKYREADFGEDHANYIVELYLKSINNESNEFRTIGNNEQLHEFCLCKEPTIQHDIEGNKYCIKCLKYIKQNG